MRVGLNREEVGIDRQRVGVANDVAGLAGWNLDGLGPEPQNGGRARWRLITEIQADLRQHLFDCATWLQVKLYDQVAAGLEGPRQI